MCCELTKYRRLVPTASRHFRNHPNLPKYGRMATWFVCQDESVQGPYSTDEVKSSLAGGSFSLDCLIWGRGRKEWSPISQWLKDADHQKDQRSQVQEQLWHYALDGASKGPMTRAQLVNEIKAIADKGEVLVWTKGMKAWADLFEFHDLLDEIGLNRREHPRARITGQAVIKTEDGRVIVGHLKSISGGGLGVNQILEPLTIGQSVFVDIRANELGEGITVKATVQYVTQSAFVGMKFSSISMENKARILQYVKQVAAVQQSAA